MNAIEKFFDNVQFDPNGGCWLWEGAIINSGYGQLWHKDRVDPILAHRFAYSEFVGPIPNGLDIDHLCRVRLCVNPAHLEPVTRKENLARSPITKGGGEYCKNGHEYTKENTYIQRNYKGLAIGRQCLTCHRETQARFMERKRNPNGVREPRNTR